MGHLKLMLALVAAAAVAFATAGCDKSGTSSSGKPKIVATTTMIGDLVAQIAGDKVELTVMMPAGTDPHTYKPTTKDLADVSRATRVFYNGLHLEGKMVDLFEEKMKSTTVAVTRSLDPKVDLLPWKEGEGGAHDPHVWFDVSLWSKAAGVVKETLAQADSANAAFYEERLKDLQGRLAKLDGDIKAALATVPRERRVLVTSHDAFNYYGRRYDLEVRGLQGISTETEAGLANIQDAVKFVTSRKIPAIFVESSVNPKTIQRVQADCKSAGFDVKIPGELYSDAMGQKGEHAGYAVETYEGMIRYNTDTLVNALK
jgi:manganese/zinc/iron transport system substrate-binding protein